MHSKFILFAIAMAAIFAFSAAAEEDDDEDTGARDTRFSHQYLAPYFPETFIRREPLPESTRNEQTEPLGEMRNWQEHQTPSFFDNETLDLPFKEDNSRLPVITPKIHINW